jgi:hypothetical protein
MRIRNLNIVKGEKFAYNITNQCFTKSWKAAKDRYRNYCIWYRTVNAEMWSCFFFQDGTTSILTVGTLSGSGRVDTATGEGTSSGFVQAVTATGQGTSSCSGRAVTTTSQRTPIGSAQAVIAGVPSTPVSVQDPDSNADDIENNAAPPGDRCPQVF